MSIVPVVSGLFNTVLLFIDSITDWERIYARIVNIFVKDAINIPRFVDRYNEARLLFARLNDEDIASGTATLALVHNPVTALEACTNLWTAYAYIAARIGSLQEMECEFSQEYLDRFDSAQRHMYERVFVYLNDHEVLLFDSKMTAQYSEAFKRTFDGGLSVRSTYFVRTIVG